MKTGLFCEDEEDSDEVCSYASKFFEMKLFGLFAKKFFAVNAEIDENHAMAISNIRQRGKGGHFLIVNLTTMLAT